MTHTSYDCYFFKGSVNKKVLGRKYKTGNLCTLRVYMGVIIVGSSMVISKGIKNKNTIWPVILLSIYVKEEKLELHKDISSPTFIATLCTTGKI